MKNRAFALALAAIAGLATASCATDSYHAYGAGEGYSEERLRETGWRVTFVGSTVESQQAVEQQLLRRAAELTMQSGYDWFAPRAQESHEEESVVVTGQRPQSDAAQAVWRPRWRRRSASRWTDWDPQGAVAPPLARAAPTEAATEARYSATAEIAMGHTPAPPDAFDARAILAQTQ